MTDMLKCRGCGKVLDGHPYHTGKLAWVPETGKRCKSNFYGGHVCSRECDERASLELENSMPGHSGVSARLSVFAAQSLKDNWG